MKKVTRRELILLAVVLVAFSIFAVPQIFFRGGEKSFQGTKKAAREKVYYCPMHPTYTSERPGDCPICNMKLVPFTPTPAWPAGRLSPGGGEGSLPAGQAGVRGEKERKILYYRHPMGQPDTSPVPKKDSMGMDYIPVYEEEAAGKPSRAPGHATIQIPLERQQLMGVKLGTVEMQKLTKEIRTVGRVAYDPELFTAQQEFLSAVESLQRAEKGPYHEPLERTRSLVESVRTRLRLLGMSEKEMGELEKQGVQDRDLILPGGTPPLQSVPQFIWVYGNIYEYELPYVKIGTPAKVRVPTFPDKEFTGDVRALNPVLEDATRSVRVRVRVANPEGLLRPEMYVDIYFEADLGEGLAVPEAAVMQTGEQTLVFVAQGDGYFEPRPVTLGARAGDFYEVKAGLEAGEQVAVSGNFLIDSESRLQAAFQGMGEGGHVHGG